MAPLAQRAQPGVERDRVGGGQFGRAEARRLPPPQRAQIGFLGDQRDVVGDRGLAVGAGNADYVQVRVWHVVEAPSPFAEAPGHAVHDDVGNANVQRVFGNHGHGARGHRVRREVVAVEGSALVGEEDVARPHTARIARQPGDGQAWRGLLAEQLAQRHGAFGAHAGDRRGLVQARRNAEDAQGPRRHVSEHRRRHVAAADQAAPWLVHHDHHDDARMFGRREASEVGDVGAVS